MDATSFENLAEETLETLFEGIDEAIGDDADVDFDNGILNIELEDGCQYVINKHAPNMQIWMSSPFSGATHYAYDEEAEAWVSTRGGDALLDVLNGEIGKIAGEDVRLG